MSLTWRLRVFQWTMQASRSRLKLAKSGHCPLPSLMWPKTCSVATFPRQLPFLDTLCLMPASLSLEH